MIKFILLLPILAFAQNEREFVEQYCPNNQAFKHAVLVDCVTKKYAIEFDFSKKWAEAIGQSLYYAIQTDKLPAVFIICQDKNCKKHIHKLNTTIKNYNLNIKVFSNADN